jgi:hypothetical protein
MCMPEILYSWKKDITVLLQAAALISPSVEPSALWKAFTFVENCCFLSSKLHHKHRMWQFPKRAIHRNKNSDWYKYNWFVPPTSALLTLPPVSMDLKKLELYTSSTCLKSSTWVFNVCVITHSTVHGQMIKIPFPREPHWMKECVCVLTKNTSCTITLYSCHKYNFSNYFHKWKV